MKALTEFAKGFVDDVKAAIQKGGPGSGPRPGQGHDLPKVSESSGRGKFDAALDIADKVSQEAHKEIRGLDKNDPRYDDKVFDAYATAVKNHFGDDKKEMDAFAAKLAKGWRSQKEPSSSTHDRLATIIQRTLKVEKIEQAFEKVFHRNMHGKFVPKKIAGVPKAHTKAPIEAGPDANS